MARVSTYLNFNRKTEAAFAFYKSVFQTEYLGQIMRYGDVPPNPNCPASDKDLILHMELPILGGHVLMGTDRPESMGHVDHGNAFFINLEPDDRQETDRLFNALASGGKIEMPLAEMFWGGYFGSLVDQFGVRWMFNCVNKS